MVDKAFQTTIPIKFPYRKLEKAKFTIGVSQKSVIVRRLTAYEEKVYNIPLLGAS